MLWQAGNDKVNVVHYSSTKSKRLCRSDFAVELFALMDGIDMSLAIKHVFEKITGQSGINNAICTDSKTLYGLFVDVEEANDCLAIDPRGL